MLQLLSKVKIIDNTGGKVGTCIKILHPKGRKVANVGDIILVSVNDTIRGSKVNRGGIYKAVIVRTVGKIRTRPMEIKFNMNAVILIKQALSKKKFDFMPIGTRIKGPISSILKRKPGMLRIHFLAKSVI